ncbi:hypothetical protein LCGC14_1323800 [marine sediment metagenome]|uniref:HNH domain-containing protein n=1 Tax=marine sediment metagenome TaxID=412755 RepID=A0A0F9NL42_9ZZZZ
MKKCTKCRELKDFSLFPKRKDSSDGYRNTCKICRLEYSRKWHQGDIKKKVYKDLDGKKQCRMCMQIFNISNFGRSKVNKDGLKSYCGKCKRKESVEWRKRNKDYGREYRKKNLDKLIKQNREYRCKNKEAIEATKKEYAINNKELISIYKKDWYSKNKAKVLEGKRRRRDRQANCGENYTRGDERITLRAFDHKCFRCNREDKLNIDHHRPLVKGHGLNVGNAVVLCETCNKSKGSKDPEKFYGIKICVKLDKKLARIVQDK